MARNIFIWGFYERLWTPIRNIWSQEIYSTKKYDLVINLRRLFSNSLKESSLFKRAGKKKKQENDKDLVKITRFIWGFYELL